MSVESDKERNRKIDEHEKIKRQAYREVGVSESAGNPSASQQQQIVAVGERIRREKLRNP